ncbi:MAG: class I SAM-dependent methyltransferase [Planctomycetota bacterium]
MLARTLEPEFMDDRAEAVDYNDMDFREVNEGFVRDLIASARLTALPDPESPLGRDILDLGTGTARIPIELCKTESHVRVMAADAAVEMLELARYNIEVHSMLDRIQLHHGDAKKLIFQKEYFDTVMSNSLIHHLPSHDGFFREVLRVLRPGGFLFVRDLYRPSSDAEVERLVKEHAGQENERSQQLFRQSLHAGLTVAELSEIVAPFGIPSEAIAMSSDRHWTLSYRKPIPTSATAASII